MKILNKRALHNYYVLESVEAGIQLFGAEVKSIRAGRIDLGQSHARIIGRELYLINANIPPYQHSPQNYDPIRSRRLLMHRSQIQNLIGKLTRGGMTLVPVSIYDKHNLIKVQIGLARSKKEFDKRQVIKERDHKRRVEQELKWKE